jgi:hypothetical protein
VYRGIERGADLVPLYESLIGDVVVWPGFTSTSLDRDSVLSRFITGGDCVLFEIELHPSDVAVMIEKYSKHSSEKEVLIPASTAFKVISIDSTDVLIYGEDVGSTIFPIPVVRLGYFLHWYDFYLDQRPHPVLV